MKQEDKKLLLKDLCARVPYHPRGLVVNACNGTMCDEWLTCATLTMFTSITNNCRLYLRPMSSMTEEEQIKFSSLCELTTDSNGEKVWSVSVKGYDWLNANFFDYRGLIEKGLALEAPEGMYNLNNERIEKYSSNEEFHI